MKRPDGRCSGSEIASAKMPLRIGVNALYLIPGRVGGTEIYLRNLLGALAEVDPVNEYVIFTNRETGADLTPRRPNFQTAPQPVPASFRPARILWEQTVLPIEARRQRLDVLFNPGFTAPVCCPCPQVTVFHDLQHKRHPEYFRWFDLPFWRLLLWAAARCSALLVAVSQATAADLARYYATPVEKIRVIGHGVEERFFDIGRERQRRPCAPLVLTVSTLHPHKNLERLVRVFGRFRARHPEYSLVLAGLRGFHTKAVERAVAEADLSRSVRLTGWIPREELYELYRDAAAFLYPSLFEGFGLPVLEAWAAGIPTACSDIEPLRSLADGAALLFDPRDEEALLTALERLVSDETVRARLAAAGPERARAYSWRRAAELTLATLTEARAPAGISPTEGCGRAT
ncbi:MAG: glycosyltransferase family 1 protein [Bryobacterales bacterium]|nr:glycosyltransferase family 1 protein [Bryobacterales bacterium]